MEVLGEIVEAWEEEVWAVIADISFSRYWLLQFDDISFLNMYYAI